MEVLKYGIPVLAAISTGLFVLAALRQLAWARAHERVSELETLRRRERRSAFEGELLGSLLMPFFFIARALPFPKTRAGIADKLARAGNPNFLSPDEQLAICCAAAFSTGVVAGALAFLNSFRVDPATLTITAFGVLLGFYIPIGILAADGNRRLRMITKSLPYSLDLISLTMSAGATFVDAVKTYVRGRTGDPLVDEYRRLLAEMEFGTPRPAALANMASRIPLEDFRNIAASINQAEEFGSSLSEILKAQASLMRLKRSVAAEKAAAEASVRLLLPMTLILVAVLMLVFAPAVIRWKQDGIF